MRRTETAIMSLEKDLLQHQKENSELKALVAKKGEKIEELEAEKKLLRNNVLEEIK